MLRTVFLNSQWTSSVRRRSVSAVTTTAASIAMSCATLWMTVATAQMRERRTVRVRVSVADAPCASLPSVSLCRSVELQSSSHHQHRLFSQCLSLRKGQSPTHGPCTDDEYKCSNGQCIPLQYACDDYDDCGDLSDELGCREYIGTIAYKIINNVLDNS